MLLGVSNSHACRLNQEVKQLRGPQGERCTGWKSHIHDFASFYDGVGVARVGANCVKGLGHELKLLTTSCCRKLLDPQLVALNPQLVAVDPQLVALNPQLVAELYIKYICISVLARLNLEIRNLKRGQLVFTLWITQDSLG
jgi:hypothetical protein